MQAICLSAALRTVPTHHGSTLISSELLNIWMSSRPATGERSSNPEEEHRALYPEWSLTGMTVELWPPIPGAIRAGRGGLLLTRVQASQLRSSSGLAGRRRSGRPMSQRTVPDRAEDGGPYESLHGTGFGYDYLAPVCSIGENLYDRS